MRRAFSVGLCLLFVAGAGAGDNPAADPKSPVPPTIVLVSHIDAEAGTIRVNLFQGDGDPFYKGEPGRKRESARQTVVRLTPGGELKGSQFRGELSDAAGKVVPAADAFKRLKDGTTLLLSGDGGKVSPLYLQVVKEDTLVLVLERRDAPKLPPNGGIKFVPIEKK
jgi:hypothetical protein